MQLHACATRRSSPHLTVPLPPHHTTPPTHPPTHTLQRLALLDELFAHVVPHLGGKKAPRDFPASEDASLSVGMFSALLMQMVQARVGGGGAGGTGGGGAREGASRATMAAACARRCCITQLAPPPLAPRHKHPQASVDLPAMDCDPERMADSFLSAAAACDAFWARCLDRLAEVGCGLGGEGGWVGLVAVFTGGGDGRGGPAAYPGARVPEGGRKRTHADCTHPCPPPRPPTHPHVHRRARRGGRPAARARATCATCFLP